MSQRGIETSKGFWNFIKPFLTNKGIIASSDITIVDRENVIPNEYQLANKCSKYYRNIVEKSGGTKPLKLSVSADVNYERVSYSKCDKRVIQKSSYCWNFEDCDKLTKFFFR